MLIPIRKDQHISRKLFPSVQALTIFNNTNDYSVHNRILSYFPQRRITKDSVFTNEKEVQTEVDKIQIN
jgi:hypothetical protein